MKNSRENITIGIVDDHQIVIDGLVSMLQDYSSISVGFVTTNPLEVLGLLGQVRIDILITDVMMPHLSGILLAKEVKVTFPGIQILALSMTGDAGTVDEMIRDADIAGYALKNISRNELYKALDKIAAGGVYFSPEVLQELRHTKKPKELQTEVSLTAREIEIVRLIEKELNNRDIAALLFISERTVETHRKNIFRKTNTNSLIGLVKYAYQHNIVTN